MDNNITQLAFDEFFYRLSPIEWNRFGFRTDVIPTGTDPACVWTAIDTERGVAWKPGQHEGNGWRYLVCKVPVPAGEHYEALWLETKPKSTSKHTELTEDELDERFALADFGDGEFTRDTIPDGPDDAYVWTALDDGESSSLVSGKHFVNRSGYVICAVPVPAGESFEVNYPDDDEDSETNGHQMKTGELIAYMTLRAAQEGLAFELAPEFLEALFRQGVRSFFGVQLDNNGRLMEDKQNPEAYREWQTANLHFSQSHLH